MKLEAGWRSADERDVGVRKEEGERGGEVRMEVAKGVRNEGEGGE